MSELGHLLRTLRGKRSADHVAARCKPELTRESIFRIERGDPVKLITVRNIAKALNAKQPEYFELVCAWLNFQAGDDRKHLVIQPKVTSEILRDTGFESSDAVVLFNDLNHTERKEILFAMRNPQVMQALAAINKLAAGVTTHRHTTSPHAHRKNVYG